LSDPRPSDPLSVGFAWAYRITAIGLEFSLPILVGHLIDDRWETRPVATLVGAALGFAAGMLHLVRLAQPPRSGPPSAGN